MSYKIISIIKFPSLVDIGMGGLNDTFKAEVMGEKGLMRFDTAEEAEAKIAELMAMPAPLGHPEFIVEKA